MLPPRFAQRPHAQLELALAAGIIIRLLWIALIPNTPVSDQEVYQAGATSLAAGEGFNFGNGDPNGFWPVGYSALLAPAYALFGPSLTVAYFVNLLFAIGLIIAVYALGRRVVGPTVGAVAAWTMALYPTMIAYTTIVASENVYLPILTAFVIATLAMYGARRSWAWTIAAGLLLGIGILVRPPALALPAVALVAGWALGRSWQQIVLRTAVCTTLGLAVCVPWGLRNQSTFGVFKLSAFNGGPVLWFGNHDGPPETVVPPRFHDMTVVERDRAMQKEAIAYIKAHPGIFIQRCFARTWTALRSETVAALWNERGLQARFGEGSVLTAKVIFSLGYYVLLVGTLVGLWLRRRHWLKVDSVLLMTIAVSAAPFIVFDSQNRYHLPLVPIMAVYFGVAAVRFTSRRLTQSGERPTEEPGLSGPDPRPV